MTQLLSLALLTSVALTIPANLLLFTCRDGRRGPSSATHSIVAAVVVALAGLGAAGLIGAGPAPAAAVGTALGASVLGWHRAGRPWDVRGLVAWALTVDTMVAYVAYVLVWTLTADAGVITTTGSLALWLLEVFVLVIGAGYLWELVDVLARRDWVDPERLKTGALAAAGRSDHQPFVTIQVPAHNEPPDLVIETLEHLLRLDYDHYEVQVVDNNTTDPALWRPLEEFCARHGKLKFIHLEDWPGFKSGALNHALTKVDPRSELIAIVDADYHVDPDFLRECTPLFADPEVSFVQTPQDYRDWEVAPYFRRLYHSYNYFFRVSQRSRNERNAPIFGGTMGLIRRSALEQVGGWDEWCITEDAELSLRLLKAGTRGVHVDRAYGRGVMPLTFESLKGQRFRWCFGGIQILRMHWRSLLPGRRTTDNQLDLGQRWAYFVGGLQWFGDLAGVVFTAFLAVGALDAVLGTGLVLRRLSGLMLVAVVLLVVIGTVRAIALVRRANGVPWGEAAGAFGMWLALSMTVARASWLGLVSKQGTFLRTPKVKGEPGISDALRGNVPETLAALLCAAIAIPALAHGDAGPVAVGALLVMQGAGYAAAPLNSIAAIRSDLPEELRRRRAWMFGWRDMAVPARRGAFVTGNLVAALGAFVVLASPVAGPSLEGLPGAAVGDDAHRGRNHDVPAAVADADASTGSSDGLLASGSDGTGVPGAFATATATSGSGRSASGAAGGMAPGGGDQAGQSSEGPSGRPTADGSPAASGGVSPSASPSPTPSAQPTPTSQPSATPSSGPTRGGSPTRPPQASSTGRPTQAAAPSKDPKPSKTPQGGPKSSQAPAEASPTP